MHPVPPATAQQPPQQSPQQPQKRPPQRQAQQRPPQQSPQRRPQQSAQRRDGQLRHEAPTQERWAAAAEASGLEAQLDAAKTARVAAERVTAEYAAQVRGMHAARSAAAAERQRRRQQQQQGGAPRGLPGAYAAQAAAQQAYAAAAAEWQRQRQRQRQQGGAPRGLPGAYTVQAPTPSGALTPPVAAVELATSSTDALVQRVRLGGCPFRCLGLERGASQEEVRKRYRALALRLHPDKAQHPQANEAFAALKSAYSRAKEAAAASAVWAARPSASARPRAAS